MSLEETVQNPRLNQRRRQKQYEARRRVGVALYWAPIEALVALSWLAADAMDDRRLGGQAAVIRDMAGSRKIFPAYQVD